VSAENQDFCAFWAEKVTPYLAELGYDLELALGTFLICSTGDDRYGSDLVLAVDDILDVVFEVDEVIRSLNTSDTGEGVLDRSIYAGYCRDTALGAQIRVSGWLFLSADGAASEKLTITCH